MPYTQLTEQERYQISALQRAGHDQATIAQLLHRHPSTISRELKRNRGLRGYRPKQAHRFAQQRKEAAYKAFKVDDQVYAWIEQLIRQELSPQQVVCYLKRARGVVLHHETVYQLIYADQAAGGDLYQHLRIARKAYRTRYGHNDRRGQIVGRVGIEQRPAVVDRCSRIGDWEGDTIIGKGRKSALLTLVERKTLYTVMVRLKGKQADRLAQAAVRCLSAFQDRVKTITVDNGKEFAAHQTMAEGLKTSVYFARPYASWQRGINENTNGLIRQYFPKGTDFNQVSDEHIQSVMDRLNNRPRITRGGKQPNELFLGKCVDLIAA